MNKEDIEKLFEIKNDEGEIAGSLGNIEFVKYDGGYMLADTLRKRIGELK